MDPETAGFAADNTSSSYFLKWEVWLRDIRGLSELKDIAFYKDLIKIRK